MLQYIKHFKKLSVEIQRSCQQFDLQFIDTSQNWSDSIQTAYESIIGQLAI